MDPDDKQKSRPTPMPVQEVNVGTFKRWLSTFNDHAYIAVQVSDGKYVAPTVELGQGRRSLVNGHYDAAPNSGFYFVIIKAAGRNGP